MTFLNDAQIASKCVEVSKSLSNLESSLFTYDLRDTTTIGDAARLCVCIKNISERITERMLAAAAASLKIHYRIVQSQLLPLFEYLGWVRIKRAGNKIESFIEQIPPTQDFLSTLGKKWKEDGSEIIDRKSAGILVSNEMIVFPKILSPSDRAGNRMSRWYNTISKRYKSISPERILGMAKFCTFGGFFYLVVILFVVVFTFPTEPSACPIQPALPVLEEMKTCHSACHDRYLEPACIIQ